MKKTKQPRDSKGRYKIKINTTWFIIITCLCAGMYLQALYSQYNAWYCRNSAIMNIRPIGLPTRCPIDPIGSKKIPTLWFIGEIKAEEPTAGDLYEWARNLHPSYEASQSGIAEKIKKTFGNDWEIALKIAQCESGLNPKAKNKNSSARGIYQIMQSWHRIDEKWLLNEDINIAIAKQLYDEQGWNPWNASKSCWSK